MDLAVRQLNVDALIKWKNTFLSMSIWMQAVLVGVLVLLAGASVLSCWWGLRMTRSARFAFGATSVFYLVMILLTTEYELDSLKALIFAAVAGVAGGFLYTFLERVFQFVAGFVFGSVLAAWLLPKFFHLKPVSGAGRIWALVIAIAAGALFALLARKLKMVLTALEGGVILGLLAEMLFPVDEIPWINERLSEAQIRNILPLAFALTGLLIQFFQFLAIRSEQKSLQIPAGEEQADDVRSKEGESGQTDDEVQNPEVEEDAVSIARAEEVLVEKAKELAMAAARSTQQTRLKERCEDVSQGLYSVETAADRLGMTQEAFLQEMKRAGYALPGEKDEAGPESVSEESAGEGSVEGTAAGEESGEEPAGPDSEKEPAAGPGPDEGTATGPAPGKKVAAKDDSVKEGSHAAV